MLSRLTVTLNSLSTISFFTKTLNWTLETELVLYFPVFSSVNLHQMSGKLRDPRRARIDLHSGEGGES